MKLLRASCVASEVTKSKKGCQCVGEGVGAGA